MTCEAVAIDLVEDLREHCRYYVFEQNGWEHESDGGYGKGWSKVQTEWQRAIKRLKALGYQLIYVSKELKKEITLKGGATRTTFMPNIDDKTANFLTGTVDLTMRAFADSDDNRHLQLSKKHNVFGGGRFKFEVETCPLNYDEFLAELKIAQEGTATKRKTKKQADPVDEVKEDKPKRERKKREEEPVNEEIEMPEDLSALTVKELRNLAEELGIDTDDLKRKAEIIEAIEELQTEDAEEEVEEEKPQRTRQRRERKPVEDDTPPGEEETQDTEEEKPRRQRRTRR